MKRYSRHLLLLLVLLILTSAFLTGCGSQIKTEQELQEDLIQHPGFSLAETAQITEFSIIKRLTDEKAHTDTVYVSVDISHENVQIKRAYTLYYTKYNEGWLLDRLEEYYGDDAVWEFTPKEPGSEQILNELIGYSNRMIDANNSMYTYASARAGSIHTTYYFEEGKYSATVFTGDFVSSTDYACIVETERKFNYAEVNELLSLYFVFDESTCEWVLSSVNSVFIDGQWNLPEAWVLPSTNSSFILTHTSSYRDEYTATFIGEYFAESTLEPDLPSVLQIPVCTYFVFEDEQISISPDGLWYLDEESGNSEALKCTSAEIAPTPLESTGLISVNTKETDLQYQKVAKDFLLAILSEYDPTKAIELWHPTYNQETAWYYTQELLMAGYETTEIIPMITVSYPEYEARETEEVAYFIEELEQLGCHVDVIGASQFLMRLRHNDGLVYDTISVIFVKESENIYIIDVN